MAGITKLLGIAISDAETGRITHSQLLVIFQDAIDNGDILEEANEQYIVEAVLPLIDAGVLEPSIHVATFEQRMGSMVSAWLGARRRSESSRDCGSKQIEDFAAAPAIVAQANAVRRILYAYIAIHDDIFGGGRLGALRRLVPIPGFFRAIDFDMHTQDLRVLAAELEELQTAVGSERASMQLAGPLSRYCFALLVTVTQLQSMCVRLAGRGENPATYSKCEYRRDLAEYKRSVAEYRSLGDDVNRAFRAILS